MLNVSIGTDMALGRYNKTLNHGVCYKVSLRLQESYNPPNPALYPNSSL